ncbi:MAG: ATP-binding protein, partial [Clostridia bacterium]
RKRFTANVSHELRTPLTTIGGYAELLQNGMAQAQDVPVFARKIYDESRRLLRLVEDILHLSKLDEGFIAGKLQRLDLFEVAKEALHENEETAKDRNVTLKLRGESVWVQGDPTLLDEMLRNVIENGVKYNHSNGLVEVTVSHENGKARVSVADTGIGIPQEHLEQVFERFYRVDGSRSKQSGGTGLGLSIVKHGAEYHQAKIKMKSELGVGTTVQMIFDDMDAKNEC